MANLVFPQLASGALVQYPIRKHAMRRTVKNLLADGTMLVASDPGASQLQWTLSYVELQTADMNAIQAHFAACSGALRAFTFLDPTDNLLTSSADFTGASWIVPSTLKIQSGLPDPIGGVGAFTVTNTGSAVQQIVQTLAAPVNYQYCFSVYAASANSATCNLSRGSANAQAVESYQIGPAWSRLVSSGALNDTGTGFMVAITIAAGQTVSLFGPQLEAQIAPSRFRATYSSSGLYLNAHWAVPEIVFSADGPDLFSTSFSIETSIAS